MDHRTDQTPSTLARVALLLLLVACGGDDDDPTEPPPVVTPAIGLVATPANLSVARGQSGTATISLTRTNYTGAVDLTAEGVPAGVTATFSSATLPNGTASSTLTLATTATAALGPSTITVRARGSGVTEQAATVTLTVTAPPAIAITAPSTPLDVVQGSLATRAVSIARTNYTGPVALAVSGLPAGVSVASVTATGDEATLVFSVDAASAPGTATATVTASAAGVTSATTTVPLTVTAITGSTVRYAACGLGPEPPRWVAAQDGTGAWRPLVAGADGNYTFGITSRGGVAVVSTIGATNVTLNLFYGSLADLRHLAAQPCPGAAARTLTGSVSGVATGETSNIRVGNAFANVAAPGGGFTLTGAPAGLVDIIATKRVTTASTPNRIVLRSGVDATGGTLAAIDFAGSESFTPETRIVTISGAAGGETVSAFASLTTARGTFGLLSAIPGQAVTSISHPAIPAARLAAGDIQSVTLNASDNVETNGSRRSVYVGYRAPLDRALAFGTTLGPVTVSTVATAPYVRLRAQYTRLAEYDAGGSATYSQTAGGISRSVSAQLTASYLAGASTFDFTLPDFSGVAVWQNAWGLQPGSPIAWNVGASGWTGAPLEGFFPGGADGVVVRSAARTGTITP